MTEPYEQHVTVEPFGAAPSGHLNRIDVWEALMGFLASVGFDGRRIVSVSVDRRALKVTRFVACDDGRTLVFDSELATITNDIPLR